MPTRVSASNAQGKDLTIEVVWFADDGLVPNNATVPLIIYRHALAVGDTAAEQRIEAHFASHDWRGAWVNGIYPFHHYHSISHEVLGIARGQVRVQFGGASGPIVAIAAGDAVMIPAGVGHCRVSADDGFSVVGAYPGGAEWDLCRATPEAHDAALARIAAVPHPSCDPLLGPDGPACRSHPR